MPKRKCKFCGEYVREFIKVPAGVFCDMNHAVKFGQQQAFKSREKQRLAERKKAEAERKAYKQETARRKESAKSLLTLCIELQDIVNKCVMIEDRHKGCISCSNGSAEQCGHFYHAGTKYRTSRLRFARENLNGQCVHCNCYVGGGNQREQEKGIIERYGKDHMDRLELMKLQADRGELEPLTKEEVRELKAEYRLKLKNLKLHSS